jgi:hypothetical protein
VPEITLDEMIAEMVEADLSQAKQVSLLRQARLFCAFGR